jgi:hypothetical protein
VSFIYYTAAQEQIVGTYVEIDSIVMKNGKYKSGRLRLINQPDKSHSNKHKKHKKKHEWLQTQTPKWSHKKGDFVKGPQIQYNDITDMSEPPPPHTHTVHCLQAGSMSRITANTAVQ